MPRGPRRVPGGVPEEGPRRVSLSGLIPDKDPKKFFGFLGAASIAAVDRQDHPTASVCGSRKRSGVPQGGGGGRITKIIGKGGRRPDPGLLVLDAPRLEAEANETNAYRRPMQCLNLQSCLSHPSSSGADGGRSRPGTESESECSKCLDCVKIIFLERGLARRPLCSAGMQASRLATQCGPQLCVSPLKELYVPHLRCVAGGSPSCPQSTGHPFRLTGAVCGSRFRGVPSAPLFSPGSHL